MANPRRRQVSVLEQCDPRCSFLRARYSRSASKHATTHTHTHTHADFVTSAVCALIFPSSHITDPDRFLSRYRVLRDRAVRICSFRVFIDLLDISVMRCLHFATACTTLCIITTPSPSHSFIPGLKPSFSANPYHRSLPYLLQN